MKIGSRKEVEMGLEKECGEGRNQYYMGAQGQNTGGGEMAGIRKGFIFRGGDGKRQQWSCQHWH